MPAACPSRIPRSDCESPEKACGGHDRPLQGERVPVLREEVGASRPLTPDEVLTEVWQGGLSTPREATAMTRSDRDGR